MAFYDTMTMRQLSLCIVIAMICSIIVTAAILVQCVCLSDFYCKQHAMFRRIQRLNRHVKQLQSEVKQLHSCISDIELQIDDDMQVLVTNESTVLNQRVV
jgi:hypothetical protein